MVDIELFSIGNELLLGTVLDTNSHWLCRQLTQRGGHVRRVVQLRDDVAAIAREIRGALEREAGLVIITGGLGPTDDDCTLEGVAAGLGRPLVEHAGALRAIAEQYQRMRVQGRAGEPTITPSRRKMALLPAGGEPLANPAGTAPGVLVREGQVTVVCLPGVPEEMKAILSLSMGPLLDSLLGPGSYAEWDIVVSGAGESTLAPFLRQAGQLHPDVYFKSRAQYPYQGQLLITLSRSGGTVAEVEAGLQAALEDLRAQLTQEGIEVSPARQATAGVRLG